MTTRATDELSFVLHEIVTLVRLYGEQCGDPIAAARCAGIVARICALTSADVAFVRRVCAAVVPRDTTDEIYRVEVIDALDARCE